MSGGKSPPLTVITKPLSRVTRDLNTVEPISYSDTFTITGLQGELEQAPAEEWARAVLGNVPNLAENVIWSGLLRFKLHRQVSHTAIAGWQIGGRGGDNWVRLENSSWLMDANILVSKDQGQEVSFSTLLRYKSLAGRLVWSVLGVVHRWVLPRLLRAGARKLQKDE